jgi:hypothetical protein
MRTALTAIIMAASAAFAPVASAQPPIRTPAEQTDFRRYTQSQDVWAFLETISAASRRVRVEVVGKTGEAKDFAPANLYLVVITEEGAETPKELDRKKPTILVMASQHGNEHSGKEAALTLIRDLASGDLKPLLKQVNVLVMPQANPYGNSVDRRPNEQGLDLNRDHVKLESPETRAIHAVFGRWMPEVSLDLHEKGDDYYRVNTGCVTNANIAAAIRRFSIDTIYKETEAYVQANGSTWHEYLVTEAMGSQGAAGAPEPAGASRETLTRPSTTDLNDGRNSLGIYETMSFIQEGASRHDIPTLQDRTAYQYLGVKALVQSVARHAAQVLQIVNSSRAALSKRAQAPEANDLIHLRMVHARDPKEPEITIQAFERPAAGAAPEPAGPPKVVTNVVKNWFPAVEPTLSVPRPYGYIIPAAHQAVADRMRAHGIAVQAFTAAKPVEVEQYQVDAITPASEDYVAPESITVTKKTVTVTVQNGDYYVSGAQPAANLIPNLLEPQAEFGFIRYRAFKLVPEKGAIFPFLRVAKRQALPLAAVK